MRRSILSLYAVTFLTACAGGTAQTGESPTPAPSAGPLQGVLATSEVVIGKDQRVGFGILDANQVPVPYVTVTVQIFSLAPGSKSSPPPLGPPQPAPYNGGAPGLDIQQGKGIYVIHQTFDQPGFYSAVVNASKAGVRARTTVALQVMATDPTPAVGSQAPATKNALQSEVSDISAIDTGVPPDDMHYISVAGALAARHPFVVYFGSPGFCVSRTCGPEVDVVKTLEPTYRPKGVDFIHIETYKGGRPDANHTTSPWFDEWKLPSDPWVFVVDRAGLIRAKFEAPTGPQEIEPALQLVSSG